MSDERFLSKGESPLLEGTKDKKSFAQISSFVNLFNRCSMEEMLIP